MKSIRIEIAMWEVVLVWLYGQVNLCLIREAEICHNLNAVVHKLRSLSRIIAGGED